MPFAGRLTIFFLIAGLNSVFMPCAQSQEVTPAYDPNTDPRIDRREHPNAPRPSAPASLLDSGAETANPSEKDDPIFLAFAAWIQKYRLASDTKKLDLVAEGVTLARTRRSALSELIKNNPKRAIDWAISYENRIILPALVQEHLETRVAGCGEYNVLYLYTPKPDETNSGKLLDNPQTAAPKTNTQKDAKPGTGKPSGPSYKRYVVINGKVFQAYVYGWRARLTTKYNIPLHGVAIDNSLAVNANPARVLAKGEAVPENAKIGNPDRKCPLCGADCQETGQTATVAQIGNIYYFFDNEEHLGQLMDKFARLQLVIGPKTGSVCDEPLTDLLNQIQKNESSNAGVSAGNNGVPAGAF